MKLIFAFYLTTCIIGIVFARSAPKLDDNSTPLEVKTNQFLDALQQKLLDTIQSVKTAESMVLEQVEKKIEESGNRNILSKAISKTLSQLGNMLENGLDSVEMVMSKAINQAGVLIKSTSEKLEEKYKTLEQCAKSQGVDLPAQPDVSSCIEDPFADVDTAITEHTNATNDILALMTKVPDQVGKCFGSKHMAVSCLAGVTVQILQEFGQIVKKLITASMKSVSKTNKIASATAKCVSDKTQEFVSKISEIDTAKCLEKQ